MFLSTASQITVSNTLHTCISSYRHDGRRQDSPKISGSLYLNLNPLQTPLFKSPNRQDFPHLQSSPPHPQKGNTYTDLFNPLTTRNIEVHAWDQRGWGLSVQAPKQKGLTGPTSLVISDIDSVITSVITTTSDSIPLFLMGHSMGGGETLTFAAVGPPATRKHIRGYLAESPLIALAPATRPWAITEISGRMAAKVLPHFHMVNALNPALLSRDAAVGKEFAEDPLCHDTGTLEGLEGMLDRGKNLDEDGGGVVVGEDVRGQGETGVWVAHGSGDGIVDFDASRRWVERCAVQDKEFKGYEGWYHRRESD